jgi:molecular chaperone GrpE
MSKKHTQSKPHPPSPEEEADLPISEPAALEEETAELVPEEQAEPEELLQDQMLRLQADFDNFRKRMAREKKDWIAFASENIVMELLPVLDHFELGLADSEQNGAPESLTEGFRLIYTQLCGALDKAGVKVIDAQPGEPFDPQVHEAISHLPSEDIPEGEVVAQTRRGYQMGEKLLRAAQVVVSSGPAE